VNRSKQYLFIGLLIFAAIVAVTYLLRSVLDHEKNNPGALVKILGDADCEEPCIGGQSIRNASIDEVRQVFRGYELTENTELLVRKRENSQVLEWHWPELAETQLTTGDNTIIYSYGPNQIRFVDNRVSAVDLLMAISLEELIEAYGEPDWVSPSGYTRFGGEWFSFSYSDRVGYFTAWTRCDNPELRPDTMIGGYSYSELSRQPPRIQNSDRIEWAGYTDKLPNCDVFRP
jgi:hypothetical protein